MKKYAIFSDIDGTLVSFTSHKIPDSTVQALETAKKNGHKFFISTGRPVILIKNITQVEHLVDGYITTNGAHCFVGNDVVCNNAISNDDFNAALRDSDKYHYPIIIAGERDLVVYNFSDQVDRIFRRDLGVDNINYRQPLSALDGQQILQLTAFVNAEHEKILMPKLKHCVSGRWHSEFIDITCDRADKGKGLVEIAAHEGFDIADTIALGDGGNDIPIIKQAGIGVAMGNAGDDVKETADFITNHVDEDGFMNALRHYNII